MDADEQVDPLSAALGDLASATRHAEHLQVALGTNRRIGMAMGILMERHRITEEQAFDRLRMHSQRGNTKLRELADRIVHTGDEPSPQR